MYETAGRRETGAFYRFKSDERQFGRETLFRVPCASALVTHSIEVVPAIVTPGGFPTGPGYDAVFTTIVLAALSPRRCRFFPKIKTQSMIPRIVSRRLRRNDCQNVQGAPVEASITAV